MTSIELNHMTRRTVDLVLTVGSKQSVKNQLLIEFPDINPVLLEGILEDTINILRHSKKTVDK